MLPTHFTVAGDELLTHLARPNPAWPHLQAAAEVRLAMIVDHAYIPSYWPADHGLDVPAAAQQQRRLDAVGDWQTHRAEHGRHAR